MARSFKMAAISALALSLTPIFSPNAQAGAVSSFLLGFPTSLSASSFIGSAASRQNQTRSPSVDDVSFGEGTQRMSQEELRAVGLPTDAQGWSIEMPAGSTKVFPWVGLGRGDRGAAPNIHRTWSDGLRLSSRTEGLAVINDGKVSVRAVIGVQRVAGGRLTISAQTKDGAEARASQRRMDQLKREIDAQPWVRNVGSSAEITRRWNRAADIGFAAMVAALTLGLGGAITADAIKRRRQLR